MSDKNNRNSRPQVIAALLDLIGTVGVAVIGNWDKFFPSKPSQPSSTSTVTQQSPSPLPPSSDTPQPFKSSLSTPEPRHLPPPPSVQRDSNVSKTGVAIVFDPPSNVRKSPSGEILCAVRERITIDIYGSIGSWYYTDICGIIGVIDSSQITLQPR